MAAPVRFQKAVSGLKENAAVKRRKACRPALRTGGSLPLKGQAQPQGGQRCGDPHSAGRRFAPLVFGGLRPLGMGANFPKGGRAPVAPER